MLTTIPFFVDLVSHRASGGLGISEVLMGKTKEKNGKVKSGLGGAVLDRKHKEKSDIIRDKWKSIPNFCVTISHPWLFV